MDSNFNSILDISNTFKDYAELKTFAESQYKLILELSKKINKLEQEKASVEKLLKEVDKEAKKEIIREQNKGKAPISDEEQICIDQLKLLNEMSTGIELNMEQSKKVEIFTKLLLALRAKTPEEKKDLFNPSSFKDEDLLKLVKEIK